MSNLFWIILVKLATWKGAENSQNVSYCPDVKVLQAAETNWKQSQLVKTSVQSNSRQVKRKLEAVAASWNQLKSVHSSTASKRLWLQVTGGSRNQLNLLCSPTAGRWKRQQAGERELKAVAASWNQLKEFTNIGCCLSRA